MSEGDPGPVDPGGGRGSFWTSLPTILSALAVFVTAIVGAIVQLRGGDGDSEGGSTTQTTSTPGLSHFVAMTRPGGRNYFEGEKMFVKASEPAQPVLVLAEGDKPLQDVRMKVRAEWISGAKDYGIGLVCRYANANSYYLLSVLSGGRYHIVRYRKGKPVSLTGGIQTSGLIEEGANDIDVKCIGSDPTALTLVVDGKEIKTVRDDDGIEQGNVGIRVGTSESVVTCSFRDFTLNSL
jgi:hypothetical protein